MNHDFPCKKSYIGAPVKAIANVCQYCGKQGNTCGCAKKESAGICTAVVDDANEVIYLYGNVMHENYHVPGNQCIPYTVVPSAGFARSGRKYSDEYFTGVQDHNEITLPHAPIVDNTFLVFLNGVKQRAGEEYDYTIVNGDTLHFNFYELLDTDTVEVMYTYGDE